MKVNSGKEKYAEGAKREERKGNRLSQAGRRSENKRWDDAFCAGFPVEAASWRDAVQGRGVGRCEDAWLQMLQAFRAMQWTHACGRLLMSSLTFLVTFGVCGV